MWSQVAAEVSLSNTLNLGLLRVHCCLCIVPCCVKVGQPQKRSALWEVKARQRMAVSLSVVPLRNEW